MLTANLLEEMQKEPTQEQATRAAKSLIAALSDGIDDPKTFSGVSEIEKVKIVEHWKKVLTPVIRGEKTSIKVRLKGRDF
jgi:hypothetical protein